MDEKAAQASTGPINELLERRREGRQVTERGDVTDHPGSDPVFVIVEDEADDYMLLNRALKKASHQTTIFWCRTGLETLELLTRLSQHELNICLLLDLHLPDIAGFELWSILRSRWQCESVVLAVLTGNPDPKLREQANRLGAQAFYQKPSSAEEMQKLVADLLALCTREK